MRYTITRNQLDEAAETTPVQDALDVRADYSGRAMYGKECVGVTTRSLDDVMMFMMSLADVLTSGDLDVDDDPRGWYDVRDTWLQTLANNMRYDNMGLSMIYYWPNLSVKAE